MITVLHFRQCVRAPMLSGFAAILATALPAATAAWAQSPTEIISRAPDGTAGNDSSFFSSISDNGRFVAFHSVATNLGPSDTNGVIDVYVHDRLTGLSELVSVSTEGVQANRNCLSPRISGDGRFVAFYSQATNLVAGDTNGVNDVFVRDRLFGTTERVSLTVAGGQFGSLSASFLLALSADGRFVAFTSSSQTYIRDRQLGVTEHLARIPFYGENNIRALSADGRFVLFDAASGSTHVFLLDRVTGTRARLTNDYLNPFNGSDGFTTGQDISPDGNFVVLQSGSTNLSAAAVPGIQIYVLDRSTGLVELASLSDAGDRGNVLSNRARISADGRFVTFDSAASNLVLDDTNSIGDVFLRDRVAGTTVRLSLTNLGGQANNNSLYPEISADGSMVVFHSSASNLIAGQTISAFQVYLVGLATGDSVPAVTPPPDVTEEATGPLTAVDLQPGLASAHDPEDGPLTPVPDTTGPFPLGTTVVTWSATDSAGNTATATQSVTVVDTTAPAVIAPPDSQAEATGPLTSADLQPALASAFDLVDGALTPTADVTGPFPLVVTFVVWSATDASGNTGTATQTVTIVDTTAPDVTAPPNVTLEATGPSTAADLQPSLASAVDLVDGPLAPVSDTLGPFPLGTTAVIWSATDASGNTGTATQTVTIVDTTAPDITAPPNVTVAAEGPLTAVDLGSASAFDLVDGPLTPTPSTTGPFPVGITLVTWSATDAAGNTGTVVQQVQVVEGGYVFSGFYGAVENPPMVNDVVAGRGVAVRFSLGGYRGLSIFAPGYPVSYQVPCEATAVENPVEETILTSSSHLSYKSESDLYTYAWKTEASWAGTCRRLNVRLSDGTDRIAHFSFR